MDNDDRERDNYLAILHPELMSKQDLLTELMQRKIKEPQMRSMDKNDLVDLFYKTIVPLPQRKYRMNRRGKLMTRHQILMAKRKRTYSEANTSKSFEVTSIYSKGQERDKSNSSSRLNLPTSTPAGDRLKPPPSTASERKIISLKSKSETSNADNNLGIISFTKSSNKVTSSETLNTKKAKISPNKEEHNVASSNPIKIKRHSFGASTAEHSDKVFSDSVTSSRDSGTSDKQDNGIQTSESKKTNNSDEEPVVKKFKKIAISWP